MQVLVEVRFLRMTGIGQKRELRWQELSSKAEEGK
jgi:hypothetical protein